MEKKSVFIILGVFSTLTAIFNCGGDPFSASTDSNLIADSGTLSETLPDSNVNDVVETGSNDTSVPDTLIVDTSVPPDTSVPDTFVADTSVPPDTSVPDTFVADTSVPPDTSIPDTFVADTSVPPDTSIPDTFVGDNSVPPDTSVPDSSIADTWTPPDTGIADTNIDTSTEGGVTCNTTFHPLEYNSPTTVNISASQMLSVYFTMVSGVYLKYFYGSTIHANFPSDQYTFPLVFVSVCEGNCTISALDESTNTPKPVEYYDTDIGYFVNTIGLSSNFHNLDSVKVVEKYFRCYKKVYPIPSTCPSNIPSTIFTYIGKQGKLNAPNSTSAPKIYMGLSRACEP